MSVSADTLALMVAAGLSGEQIVEIARSIEADRAPSSTAGAVRARRFREKRRAERNVTDNVTRNVTERNAEPSPSPPPPSFPQTPNQPPPPHPHPEPETRTRKADRAKQLPDDWEPPVLKAGTVAADIVHRWQPGRIERELSRFRDHHRARGTRMVDWDAAWRTWIGKSDEFGHQNGRGNGAGNDSPHGPSTRAGLGFLSDLDRSDAGHA